MDFYENLRSEDADADSDLTYFEYEDADTVVNLPHEPECPPAPNTSSQSNTTGDIRDRRKPVHNNLGQ